MIVNVSVGVNIKVLSDVTTGADANIGAKAVVLQHFLDKHSRSAIGLGKG